MLSVSDKVSAQSLVTSPGRTTTRTITRSVTTAQGVMMEPGSAPDSNLAMVLDSMGLMKII
jgi:hypothetical protein